MKWCSILTSGTKLKIWRHLKLNMRYFVWNFMNFPRSTLGHGHSCSSLIAIIKIILIISLHHTKRSTKTIKKYPKNMLKARTQKAMMTNKCEFLIHSLPRSFLTHSLPHHIFMQFNNNKKFYLTNDKINLLNFQEWHHVWIFLFLCLSLAYFNDKNITQTCVCVLSQWFLFDMIFWYVYFHKHHFLEQNNLLFIRLNSILVNVYFLKFLEAFGAVE